MGSAELSVRKCEYRYAILFVAFMMLFAAPLSAQPEQQISRPIDASDLITLKGNVHPLARTTVPQSIVDNATPIRRLVLVLGRSAKQQASLQALLTEQQTPGSANFHKWLTPKEFGAKFGVSDADLQTVSTWLAGNGFEITKVSPSKTFIEFNGTAGQLQRAFGTEMRRYAIDNKEYTANANDPSIPAALSPVVKGFLSLNNFPLRYYAKRMGNFSRDLKTGVITPELTTGNGYYGVSPADFAKIYNSLPLLSAGIDGAGQSIAVVGETNINHTDIENFRSVFGLGAGNTEYILDGFDPGITSIGEETEAVMDIEWSSAVAPGATVKYVFASSTEVTQGVDLSALYIVENNLAGVMTESYGQCESNIGEGANLFRLYLSEQASAQGITVITSSGDNGAAGCDAQSSQTVAMGGLAVNGLASTPYIVAVGGTDFDDSTNFDTYWTTGNSSIKAGNYTLPFISALSYIPERTWNDSCGDASQPGALSTCANKTNEYGGLTLWAGSGGRSSCGVRNGAQCAGYTKPSWQVGTTPNDGVRDLPDVSFFAAGSETTSKSFYVLCQADALTSGPACVPDQNNSIRFTAGGGTSAGAPSFAGVVALAMQKAGTRFGNLNPLLYAAPASSFQDVTKGTISMPCAAGSPDCSSKGGGIGVLVDENNNPAYSTSTGYDLATGLGTPNIANLVEALASLSSSRNSTATTLNLNGGTSTVTAQHGSPITVSVDVANSGGTGNGPAGDVAIVASSGFAVDGTSPTAPLTVGSNGHSTASWSSVIFPGGTYDVYANYSGDAANAASKSPTVTLNIAPEDTKVFAIVETCSGNSLVSALVDSATMNYGGCYFLRYDVTDAATGTFLGLQGTVVASKCQAGAASCPTGSITVTDNGVPLDGGSIGLNPYGYTEDRLINLSGGTHTIVASYAGDSSYNPASGSITITINKASTTVSQPTATPATPTTTQSVQLVTKVATTTVGTPPAGTVTFYDNGTALTGSLAMTGKDAVGSAGASTLAVLTTRITTAGTHVIRAQYNGDSNYNSSSLSPSYNLTVTAGTPVAPAISSVTASSTPVLAGVATTLRTTIEPAQGSGLIDVPTGTVRFMDGNTALSGTVTYSTAGTTLTATLAATFTASGSHNITAEYSGDAVYAAATTSSALAVTVDKPYTQALNQTAVTRTGGGTGTLTMSLSPASGFAGTVNVSCTSNSTAASCSAQAPSVNVPSGGATATITYQVPGLTSAASNRNPLSTIVGLNGMFVVGLFVAGVPLKRRRARWLVASLALALVTMLAACGGSGKGSTPPPPPNPITYSFTVTTTLASNPAVTSSTPFTVTVQ